MAACLKQAATDDSKFSDRADKECHTIAQASNLCLSSMGHLQREGSQQLAPSSSKSPTCNSCTIQDTVASGCCTQLDADTEAASCNVVVPAAIIAEQHTPKLLPAGNLECAANYTTDTDIEATESKSCNPRAVMSKTEATVQACLEVVGSCSLEVCAGQRVVACRCGLLICFGQQREQHALLPPL